MKKKLLVFIVIALFAPPNLAAQFLPNCAEPMANIELNINNVRTRLLNGGDMFWDPVSTRPHYEIPKDSGVHAIFAGGLWLGGIDEFGQLKVAAQTYRQYGFDYFAGPLLEENSLGATTTQETCKDFDRFWEVTRKQIDDFRQTFEQSQGYVPPSEIDGAILDWPGKGNPHFRLGNLPSTRPFAPFWDEDNNGIYDPTGGDYPVFDTKFEGRYADQIIWWIFNDKGGEHTQSNGAPLGLEISVLAYAFANEIASVNNATFYRFQIHNPSVTSLNDVYAGLFLDVDLGHFYDDFVGCLSDHNLGFVYNGYEMDDKYGENLPIIGARLKEGWQDDTQQRQDMSSFIFFHNNFNEQHDPQETYDYYQYLQGKWLDGSPITYGGNGRDGDLVHPYLFDGNPANPEAWTECNEFNEPSDRRFLLNMGPVSFQQGDTKDFTIGIYWMPLPEPKTICPNTDIFLNYIQEAEQFVDTYQTFATGLETAFTNTPTQIHVFPNPTENDVIFQFMDAQPKQLYLYDIQGKQIETHLNIQQKQWLLERKDNWKGIYFYRIVQNNATIATGKIEFQ